MKPALRIGGQMIIYYFIMILMGFLFLMPVSQTYWLLCVLSGLLLVAYGWMLYSDGASRGERAATLSVQIARQREEGRVVDPKTVADGYSPKTAWTGYVIGIALFVLVAIANIVAEPFYPPYVPATPEELAALEQATQMAEIETIMPELADEIKAQEPAAEQAPVTEDEPSRINPFNVVARLVFLPYQAAYKPLDYQPKLLNWLMLLFAVAVPLIEPIGYLQGPRLRIKKLEMIEKGKKRKMRNLKVNKQPRKRQPPKMEV